MISSVSALVLSAITCAAVTSQSPRLQFLGSIKYPNAAFTSIENGADLRITSFKPFSSDSVANVANVGASLSNLSLVQPTVLLKDVTWPNQAANVPRHVIPGFTDIVVISGGFLVPGKGNGAITLLDRETGNSKKITTSKNLWYHHVEWIDCDGDGLLDIVTASCDKSFFGSARCALYWLKQPTSNPLGSTWTSTKIIDGPDVFFIIEDIDGDGQLDLLASQFFTSKLVLYRNLNWLEPSKGFAAQLIDDSIGPVFNVITVDLNGDGVKELVATNHIGDKSGGGVFIYERTTMSEYADIFFTKYVAASDLVNVKFGPGQAAPGNVVPIMYKNQVSLVVAGDGAGKAYLLTPTNIKPFEYETSVFLDAGKTTIGFISAGDVDGDGKTEVFVPAYEKGLVHVYRVE